MNKNKNKNNKTRAKTTRRPVEKSRVSIGIVTAPMPKTHLNRAESYLDKAYVSWVEMSGANAVLIPYNTDSIATYLSMVHGVVWVGGAIENHNTHSIDQYKTLMRVFSDIFEHAVRENDRGNYFPLWGTCLGFDLLAMMGEHMKDGFFNRIQHANKFRLGPLTFTGKSKLRSGVPVALQKKIAVTPVVHHIHEYGFELNHAHTKKIQKYLKVVSIDYADNGVEFMNMFEYRNYPFYGCQWHPEQPLTDLGVELSRTLSVFLKKECAKNNSITPTWSKVSTSKTFKSKFTVLLKGGRDLETKL
jgi:gamma-glutamyl hydrolase